MKLIKQIDFPAEEIKLLKNQTNIITTRVSREYNLYHKGDILKTPWKQLYQVVKVEKINRVESHPYYFELTKEQIQLISKYKRIDVLTLRKI